MLEPEEEPASSAAGNRSGCGEVRVSSDANSLWSKAQGAFGNGNLDEAVSAAKDAKAKLEALAGTLKLDLPAAARRTAGRELRQGASQSASVPSLTITARRRCGPRRARRPSSRAAPDLARAASCAGPAAREIRGVLAELADLEQVRGQHGVGVAARRILRDAERRTEHARLGGQLVRTRPDSRRTRRIRRRRAPGRATSRVSKLGASTSRARASPTGTSKPRAALACDARGHDLVQRGRRKPQRFGHAQRGLERQRVVELGNGLTKLDHGTQRRARRRLRDADLDDAGAAGLAHRMPSVRRPSASSTACAAMVAWPTNGASLRALKNRSRTS